MTRITGEVRYICWMIRRQAQGTNLVSKSQPTKMLHRTGLSCIGLRVEGGTRLGINQKAGDSTATQLDRQHQTTWTTSRDQNVSLDDPRLNLCVHHVFFRAV